MLFLLSRDYCTAKQKVAHRTKDKRSTDSEMKGLILCLLGVTILVPVLAVRTPIVFEHYRTEQPTAVQAQGCGTTSDELCSVCIDFAVKAINVLLNIILDSGIVGSCDDLCGELAKRTNKLTGEVCDILCTLVGIDEFIKIIEKADLDPIYYCELLDVCAINDNGDAKIINATVTPKSGPQGEFTFSMTFTTLNGTGTGQLAISIQTVDHIAVGDDEIVCKSPGTYDVEWKVNAVPDPNCQGACEMWLPGTYTASLLVCYGECRSKHPHSAIYDQVQLTFDIVKN